MFLIVICTFDSVVPVLGEGAVEGDAIPGDTDGYTSRDAEGVLQHLRLPREVVRQHLAGRAVRRRLKEGQVSYKLRIDKGSQYSAVHSGL